jgi:hypothetical protein
MSFYIKKLTQKRFKYKYVSSAAGNVSFDAKATQR